ncbi:hypothetical protein H4Q26_010344 [Puccinia striiformis f. sp. tritici PST-130]|nr:hypothetical protein H4Q26_010344 [Puccinia striiformis f. sp. tritici PST-130]
MQINFNDIDSFSSDLKKTLYAAAFLTGKAFEWVQPYLEVIDDPPPNYMMNSWLMFESQLVTLYGDPNELRATEYKMGRPSTHVSLSKGLPTRVLDLLAQNTEVFDTLLELIEATLKIDTRHHERQKEKKRENDSQPSQPKKDTSKTASSSTPQLREIRQLRSQLRKPLLKSPRSLIRSITTGSRQEFFKGDFFDDPPADLETILPTIPLEPGRLSSLPDALTRREDVYPKAGEAFADKNPGNVRQLFKTDDGGSVSLLAVSTGDVEDSLNNFGNLSYETRSWRTSLRIARREETARSFHLMKKLVSFSSTKEFTFLMILP